MRLPGFALLAALATIGAAPGLSKSASSPGVGVVRGEIVDSSRRLDPRRPTSGPRIIPIVVWYPAATQGSSSYLPKMGQSTIAGAASAFRISEATFDEFAMKRTNAGSNALPVRGKFPLIIFNHGFGFYPEQNTALFLRLVAQGYIVVSIAHPGDSSDVRLADGRLVPFEHPVGDEMHPPFVMEFLTDGHGLQSRKAALRHFGERLATTRLGRTIATWRDDTLAVVTAIRQRALPTSLRPSLANAAPDRLALVGMSLGGATSAASCRLLVACRAAINLDGQNWDAALFDRPVARPLLLLQSDWTRYPLFSAIPADLQTKRETFSPNDLAYERWDAPGSSPNVIRLRLRDTRHLAFTDLEALDGNGREARVGALPAEDALASINDVVVAFLRVHVRGAPQTVVREAIAHHPELQRHLPTQVRAWAATPWEMRPPISPQH